MIRFILKWLGYAFIAVGAFQVVFQLLSYSLAYQALQQDALKLFTDGMDDIAVSFFNVAFGSITVGVGVGLFNVALGAIMIGVYEILVKAEIQNVTPMKVKKDLGNWPPSV